MARGKIEVKSTLTFGNLPIYAGDGSHTDAGCNFVINARLIYEYGKVSLRFVQQTEPNIINRNSNYPPEIEMDIANLIKLKTALKLRKEINPTAASRKFLLVGTSTLKDYASFQKPAYIRYTDDSIVFNLMHNSSQALFEIKDLFQVEVFIEFLENICKTLINSTQSFDFYRNHGIGSMLSEPDSTPAGAGIPN